MRRLFTLFLISSGMSAATALDEAEAAAATEVEPHLALSKPVVFNAASGISSFFTTKGSTGEVRYVDDLVEFEIRESGHNPFIKTNFKIMFGRVEAVMKAAPGQGIVSCLFLQSDVLDEIDVELIGNDYNRFQTNYFSRGNTTTYDRNQYHLVLTPQNVYHSYAIEWTSESVTWYLDGDIVRTLWAAEAQEQFPQTPMVVQLGTWAGGDKDLNSPGTVQWAGGPVDYSQGPFVFSVKSLTISDYTNGNEYTYSNRSKSWKSIDAVNGAANSRMKHNNEQPYQETQNDTDYYLSDQPTANQSDTAISRYRKPVVPPRWASTKLDGDNAYAPWIPQRPKHQKQSRKLVHIKNTFR